MDRTILVGTLFLLALAGCGITDGGGGTTEIYIVPVLRSEGTAVSDVPGGGTTTEILTAPPSQVGIEAGMPARVHRAVYMFELEALPPLGELTSATLYVTQQSVSGNPYGRLGPLVVDHIDAGTDLDPSDFDGGTLESAFATVTTSQAGGTFGIPIAVQILDDQANGRPRTSFRLRFAADDDGSGTENLATLSDSTSQGVEPRVVIYLVTEQ